MFKEIHSTLADKEKLVITFTRLKEQLIASVYYDGKHIEKVAPVQLSGSPEDFEENFATQVIQPLTQKLQPFNESMRKFQEQLDAEEKEKEEKRKKRQEAAANRGKKPKTKKELEQEAFDKAEKQFKLCKSPDDYKAFIKSIPTEYKAVKRFKALIDQALEDSLSGSLFNSGGGK